MTGPYEETVIDPSGAPDPHDDVLTAVWDAVARGEHATPAGGDPSDTAVLRTFRALETIPLPSEGFFADLERQLAVLAPQLDPESNTPTVPTTFPSQPGARPSSSSSPASGKKAEGSGDRPSPGRVSIFPGALRRFRSMPAAAAVLVILLIAGPLLYQLTHGTPSEPQAIPAVVERPAMETVAQFDFTPPFWDMPVASSWNDMEFSMFTVAPGATFTTDLPWYTAIDGPLTIVALSGELIVQPVGSALVYRDASSSRVPVESEAGEPVRLGPNDAIVFSSVATATGSNPGSEPVRALYSLAGVRDDETVGIGVEPSDVSRVDLNYAEHLVPVTSDGASVSIWHLELAPMDTFVYEIASGLRLVPVYEPLQINDLRIYDGAVDQLAPDLIDRAQYASLAQLKFPEPGPHTLVNVGDETVDLYFMVLEPYPDTATPAA